MKLSIVDRSGRPVVQTPVEVAEDATVMELKKALYRQKPKYYPSRQRFSLPPTPGSTKRPPALTTDSQKLSEYGLVDGSQLVFKDLGPQIGYQTVFLLEYLGPLVIYPLFYIFKKQIYGSIGVKQGEWDHYPVQTLLLAYHSFHYTKRIAETLLIHSFSHATMPIFNLFRNSGYYWIAGGVLSFFINHPLYTPISFNIAAVCIGLALLCQVGNFWSHVILTNLRADGSKGYKIPRGFLFDFITCPNYTCEIYGWTLFTIASSTLVSGLFTLAGVFQMAQWAAQKHARLKKIFNGQDGMEKYPKRYRMLPPFF